jgi:7,8-dihydropterin-6-yl-methyl-4-(beta-D-ribofuranosyl)aminobenzene 5'-phosphate synthase
MRGVEGLLRCRPIVQISQYVSSVVNLRERFVVRAGLCDGVDNVHAIVGCFHLSPAPDEIVAKTIEAFKAINPDYIIPMHCTGLNTIIAVHRVMPQKLVMPATGTRVTLGA